MDRNKFQQEVVDSVSPNESGRLLLAPRSGKTKIIIDIIKRDKPQSILWVTPSAQLAEQDIPREFDKWRAKRFKKKLTTVTWKSLPTIQGNYDLVVLDEEQFITEVNSVSLFSGIKRNRILSMTGTPTKHQDKILLYKKLNLTVLYELSIEDAVDSNVLNNYELNIVKVKMSHEKNIEAGKKGNRFYTSEYKNYEYVDNQAKRAMYSQSGDVQFRIIKRLQAIKNSPSKLEAAKKLLNTLTGRVIIFAATIDQANKLCNYRYHSKSTAEDYQLFSQERINRLAMVNSGGVGFTFRNIDHLVLVQADSDKNGLTSQKIA